MNDTPDWVLPRADGYRLYFGVPDGNIANLPADAVFDVVTTHNWHKERWQAVDRIELHGKYKGDYSRFYRVIAERDLDADEVTVWQNYVNEWEMQNVAG